MKNKTYLLYLFLAFLMLACSLSAAAQGVRTVKGVAVDSASGEPLVGAYVSLVGGRNVGAMTDLDGSFTIQLPAATGNDALLRIETIGYEETEITVGEVVSGGTISVKVKSELLDEVVVVGYGVQKKVSSVGSITQTKGEDLLRVGNITNVSEALQGQMAGVVSINTTGQPGENTASIYIRGKSTWQNTDPLVLVDGIERDMNDVDFNEIESISVLKDASATAVYGVRGGNGVILLTTKRGTSERPTVRFNTGMSFKQPTARNRWADYVTSMQIWNEANANDGNWQALFPQSTINAWADAIADGNTGPYNDIFPSVIWEDELLQTAVSENFNVNVNGKTEFMKYFASIGYQHDGSIYKVGRRETFDPRIYFNRLNWRANFDFNLTKTTVFSVNVAGKMSYRNKPYHSDVYAMLTRAPEHDFPIRWSDGAYGDGTSRGSNPLADFYEGGQFHFKTFQGWYDAKLKQNLDFITKGLSAYASISYDQSTTTRNTVQLGAAFSATNSDATQQNSYPSEWRKYDYTSPVYGAGGQIVGYDYVGDFHGVQTYTIPAATTFDAVTRLANKLYYEAGINYERKFGDHEVTALALFNRTKSTVSGSTSLSFPSYREDWVGRLTYNWKERYLFEGNISYTGSEKFAPGMRFGLFPSWSVGWRVTEEPWMKWSEKVLTNLKLRFSRGTVGTDAGAARFQYIQLFTQDGSQNFGRFTNTAAGPMYLEGSIANANATWETSVKNNLGIEIGIVSKLTLNIDLFDEQRSGILLTPQTTAAWSGATYTAANLGRTKNHGLELELGWQDKIGHDFHYYADFGFATSESRIIARDDPPSYEEHLKYAGKPIGFQTRYIVSGNYNSIDDLFNAAQSSFVTNAMLAAGDLSYIDYNADGVIDSKDKVPSPYLGYPLTTFSLKIGFDWKGLSLSALFYSPYGMHKLYPSYYLYDFPYDFVKAQPNTLDRWTPDKAVDSGFIRPTVHASPKQNDQDNSREYIDATYVRLKNVDISYSFPKKWVRTIGMSDCRIFVSGNNLFTIWGGDSRLDPETSESDGSSSDTGNIYPIVKTYTMGLRFAF